MPSARRSPRLLAAAAVALVLALGSCSSASSDSSTGSDAVSGTITVSAASSLKDAFTAMAAEFHTLHPNATVTTNFAASSTLATQIVDGAPVDAFASADQANMTKVSDAELIDGTPTLFATNSLEIVVRKGNPSNIASLADLSRAGLVYVTCAPDVPIGKYAAQALAKAGVTVNPASLEPDVKGIVSKVVAGEADAGIVYATDVTATNGRATGVTIPDSVNVVATYPIAQIVGAPNPSGAQAWIDFVTSDRGRAILQSFGFGLP